MKNVALLSTQIRRKVTVQAAVVTLAVGLCFAARPTAQAQGATVVNGGTLTLSGGSLTSTGGSILITTGGSTLTTQPGLSVTNGTYLSRVGPAFFTGELTYSDGTKFLTFPTGKFFGHYAYLSDTRYIYHFDMGFEYVVDAADGLSGVYLYDFTSNTFFYTSPSFPFPYLYDFTLKAFLYYFPDPANPGHYNTDGVRWFYNFATGQFVSK